MQGSNGKSAEPIHALAGELRAAASAWAAGDGYDADATRQLRHRAIQRCHAYYREQISVYGGLCDEAGVGPDATVEQIAAHCTVADGFFKSYDAGWIESDDFGAMNRWIASISSSSASASLSLGDSGASPAPGGVDAWLDSLEDAGLNVLYSSGTSGKLSFVPRDAPTWDSYRANGPSYLMRRVIDLQIDLSSTEAVVLGFSGGRMGIQRAGVEIARYVPKVTYLYDFEIRADMLRAALTASSREDARRARESVGAGSPAAREEAYERILATLRSATEAGQSVWLFGAPYQVMQLCARARAEGAPPLAAGSVVNLGGGWKSFEGERVDRPVLAAEIERTLGVTSERVLEAYAMVELNSPLMSCSAGRFHVPPLLEPVLYDRSLRPLAEDDEGPGAFGFLDPTATSYPGFVATGDEVRMPRDGCPCGLSGPAIIGEVRRAQGQEVRGCGGILATVRA